MTEINECAKHGRSFDFNSMGRWVLSPLQGPLRPVFPKIYAFAEPVVSVFTNLKFFSMQKNPTHDGFVASMIGNDRSLVIKLSHKQ